MSESKTITVRSRGDSFRRAGIAFTRAGVEIDPSTLTEEQREAIANEPALIIVVNSDELTDAQREEIAKKSAEHGGAKVVVKKGAK